MPLHKCLPSYSLNRHVFSTDNGQGVYFLHPVPRSTNPPGTTTFAKLLQQKGRCQPNRISLLYQVRSLIDWEYIKEQLP